MAELAVLGPMLAAAAPYMAAAGTVVSAVGTIAAGNAQKAAADFQAKQLDARATEERAASQRDQMETRHQADLVLSRQQALAAGSGFDALSPDIVNLAGETKARGEYQSGMLRYGGESRGNALNAQASGARATGQAQQTAGYIGAAGTILQGGADWFSKYGAGGPKPTASPSYYG